MRTASILLLVSLAGCGALRSPEISPVAKLRALSPGCELSVEGLFPNMAHDPISLIFSGQSKLKAYFIVPSISGTFQPAEIRVRYEDRNGESWDVESLAGTISVKSNIVTINLIQTFPGEKPRPLDFNGAYNIEGGANCKP
jgi:hypothetical protein